MEITEQGREEINVAEWRRRFGEPTQQDSADARRLMRNERIPGRVSGVRPRLVVTGRNDERMPPRQRNKRSTPGGRRFNAAFYRVANRPLQGEYPDNDSVVSDDDADDEDVSLDDGRHHNRRDNWNDDNDPAGHGGGGGGLAA